ncbi:MAG: hypothetical protein QG579_599 [Patescibacteria group bacterium]|jgi:hypothetical protein|nr:hypothetical protein [Patescibacteria group bacterium]
MSEEGFKPAQNQNEEPNSNVEKESQSDLREYNKYLITKSWLEFYKSLQDQGVKEYDEAPNYFGLSSQPRISSVDSLIRSREELLQHMQSRFTESDMTRVKALEDLQNNDEYQRLLKDDLDALNLREGDMTRPGILENDSLHIDENRRSLATGHSRQKINQFLLNYFKSHDIRNTFSQDPYLELKGLIKIK